MQPVVLVITRDNPNNKIDSNSLVLNKLFETFPPDSYYFLVPKYTNESNDKHILLYNDMSSHMRGNLRYIGYICSLYWCIVNSIKAYKRLKPSSVLIISDSGIYNLVAFILHNFCRINYNIYFFDIWLGNNLTFLNRILAQIMEPVIIRQAQHVITSGGGITQLYINRYGVKPILINNSTLDPIIPTEGRVRSIDWSQDNIRIIYTGSIYWPQRDSIDSLCVAIRGNNNIHLNIYTGEPTEEIQSNLPSITTYQNVHINRHLPMQQLLSKIKEYDIAFLPLYTIHRDSLVTKTSEPGKLVFYLNSGIPILIHAPIDSWISQYAKKYDFAYVNNDINPGLLLRDIKYIANHREESEQKVRNALRIARTLYNSATNSIKLQQISLNQ